MGWGRANSQTVNFDAEAVRRALAEHLRARGYLGID